MAISLTTPPEAEAAELTAWVAEAIGLPVTTVERIGGGRNSRVLRVVCGRGRSYVVKQYFAPRVDARSRLEVEFDALTFLWGRGIRDIPQPIAADRERGAAVYAAIDGAPIAAAEVGDAEIEQAVGFLAALKALRTDPASGALPPASEACFSARAVLENLELRLRRFPDRRGRGTPYGALADFLAREFSPARDRVTHWCQERLSAFGRSLESELPQRHRTLSPSDFGFHNGLRLADGRITYLDFEYFGWDDPAKILADFVLHPAMGLSERVGRQFAARVFALFSDDQELPARAEAAFPLVGLKWCLILLNEFVPDDLSRRAFAGRTAAAQTEALQRAQLAKARRMLRRILSTYEQFPYRT